MALDAPSEQLYDDLTASVQAAIRSRRPILHHLNADTTWLLQIPRPETAIRKDSSRRYYNILIDPWLVGGQSDVASWFSQQFHATPSAVQSIAEVENLAKEIEGLAGNVSPADDLGTDGDLNHPASWIDALAVSHEFTDHCHKDTILGLHPDTPVFAIKEAAKLISSWKHFRTVVTVETFGAGGDMDWRSTCVPPLPDWIGISRLLQKDDVLNYHAALMICFNNHSPTKGAKTSAQKVRRLPNKRRGAGAEDDEEGGASSAEAIVYTPHGIHSHDLNMIPQAVPSIHTLAFLHGLHNVRVGTVSGATALQSNLGAHNGLKAQRILNAKYWIGTHDEVKTGGGLVSWFLQRDVISVKEALDQERAARNGEDRGGELEDILDSFEGVNWYEMGNGESRILV